MGSGALAGEWLDSFFGRRVRRFVSGAGSAKQIKNTKRRGEREISHQPKNETWSGKDKCRCIQFILRYFKMLFLKTYLKQLNYWVFCSKSANFESSAGSPNSKYIWKTQNTLQISPYFREKLSAWLFVSVFIHLLDKFRKIKLRFSIIFFYLDLPQHIFLIFSSCFIKRSTDCIPVRDFYWVQTFKW